MTRKPSDPEYYGDYYDRFALSYLEKQQDGLLYFNYAIDIPATLNALSEYSQSIRGSSILDVGCGLGTYSKRLAKMGGKVTAIDISSRMAEITKDRCSGLDVRCLNQNFFEHSVKATNRYDYIVAGFMLGYFPNLDEAFSQLKSLTKSGSLVIISSIHPAKTPFRSLAGKTIGQYFDRNRFLSDFISNQEPLDLSRWIVEEVTQAACRFGFAVEKILEPRPAVSYERYGSKELFQHYSLFPSVAAYVIRRR